MAEAQRKYDRERKAEQRKRLKEKENTWNSTIKSSIQKLKGLSTRKNFQKDQREKIKVLQVILVDCINFISILDCHLKDIIEFTFFLSAFCFANG